jgi:hypothetical protein
MVNSCVSTKMPSLTGNEAANLAATTRIGAPTSAAGEIPDHPLFARTHIEAVGAHQAEEGDVRHDLFKEA